ncbi:hypothetical protein N7450_011465 [Penicillium hetheringtonii]|uniref:Uncharacterized protein n=1 Tax=Penicillium hetheringtonii TaxID=911720 RepID=A0AAD6DC50_9EURO|nr:hypothetical protein N7450_011465 [Penicillium hetheringtonii]
MVYRCYVAERSANNKPYILDIEEFFDRLGLLAGLTILGRAPGFRKTEVRRALQASIKKLD